jgi:hypothetical protein
MRDETSRIAKIGDAFSQLANVTFLPRHYETTANESISGRAHRQGLLIEKWIDRLFFWEQDPKHCERVYFDDLQRAEDFTAQHKERADNGNA